jgi:hypothetical protein
MSVGQTATRTRQHSHSWLQVPLYIASARTAPSVAVVKVKVTLRLTVSKSWCWAPCGAHEQIFITVWQLRSCFCGGGPLWREEGSVFCICWWPSPAQSFSGPSPLGLATIFYCLRFKTFLFVTFYDSQGCYSPVVTGMSLLIFVSTGTCVWRFAT